MHGSVTQTQMDSVFLCEGSVGKYLARMKSSLFLTLHLYKDFSLYKFFWRSVEVTDVDGVQH